MKKKIIYLGGFLSLIVMLLLSCEEAPLDRNVIPEGEISSISVDLIPDQQVNPQDDSGLAPTFTTLVGSNVTLASTRQSGVVKRVWLLPSDVTLSGGLTPSDTETDGIVSVEQLDPLMLTFNRQNTPNVNAEARGFLVTLTETLEDGSVEVSTTSIQVRDEVTAVINAFNQATVNAPVTFRAGTTEQLGLSTADLSGENQTVFEWNFGNGRIVDADGNITEFNEITGTNNPDQIITVVFPNVTPTGEEGELVELTVTRNFPIRSESKTENFRVVVIEGLVPDRGEGKDAIKLNASGSEIRVGYSDEIANISDISASDFEIVVDATEINDAAFRTKVEGISISEVAIAADNPNDIILSLSSDIPPVLMDNVTLSYTSESLMTVSGALISAFDDSTVSQTGANLVAASAGDFEDATTWNGGGFFFANPPDTPELSFSSERSLSGSMSFLFDTANTDLSPSVMPNNFGIGASIVENTPIVLESEIVEYVFSMWVYVERASANTLVDMFILDFVGPNPSADTSTLAAGEWVKLEAIREIDPNSMPNGNPLNPTAILRVVDRVAVTTGDAKVFIDQVDIRLVDDGR